VDPASSSRTSESIKELYDTKQCEDRERNTKNNRARRERRLVSGDFAAGIDQAISYNLAAPPRPFSLPALAIVLRVSVDK